MSDLSPKLHMGQASTAGPRARNEDFYGAIIPDERIHRWGSLVCVADGIGGCSDARRASESTVRSLLNDYYATPESWGSVKALNRVTASINAWMFRDGQKLDNGLGTTLVAALFRGRSLTLLWAGDSRAYRLRAGQCHCLTRDHVFPSPDFSMLTKAVGMDHTFSPDLLEEPLKIGDRFLLVTDGVWNVIKDAELVRLAVAETDPQHLAETLIQVSEQCHTHDNATAVVVDVVGLPSEGVVDIQRQWQDLPIIIPPKLGDELDGFRIVRKVHSGHQGLLVEAIDSQNNENVILKFPDFLLADDPIFMERFAREEWTGLRINHPNVVTFRPQATERRSAVYCVMEAVSGQTLQMVLEAAKQGLPATLVANCIKQAACGLMALHRKGVIHRDVKPDNLMMSKSGSVILVDLGTVSVQGLALITQDAPGTRIVGGTPGFMAPELYHGERGDERSDIFALGVTAYYLLTGRPPFGQPESNVTPNFTTPPAISDLQPDASLELVALVEKCLALDPKQRFGDMGELLAFMDNPAIMETKKFVPLVARNPLRFYQVGFWFFLFMTLILTLLLLS